jgi:predicted O-methyltransferase YrrM
MIQNIVYPEIERYLSELAPSEDPVLREMERIAEEREFPIIGPLVGRLCYLLAYSVRARDVFEMGSGFGYSTWFFAQAVGQGGRVVHTDGDAKNSNEAKRYLEQAGLASRVTFEVGDARQVITRYPGPFDIVFIDIDKDAYPQALELARARVRVGGLIITDNVLWSGRVTKQDVGAETAAIQRYNKEAHKAMDLVTTILPVRDGVSVSVKLAPDQVNLFRRKRGSNPPGTAPK